jgi:hypothetical protein
MARPTLANHRKFLRFANDIGCANVARGVLERLWDFVYETGDDYLGTALDIERRVGWRGADGELVRALVGCGAPEGHGFIERVTDVTDGDGSASIARYKVHDLWQHAPSYVAVRRAKEQERAIDKLCGFCGAAYRDSDFRSKYCSPACRTAAWRGRRSATERDGNGTDASVTGDGCDSTPAPALALVHPKNSSAPQAADEPPVMVFPTVGPKPNWALVRAQADEWRALFPGLDVVREAKKALAWVHADSKRRKTARGMPRFLVGWFTRTVDHGGRNSGAPSSFASPGAGRVVPDADETARMLAERRAERR